MIIQNAVKVNSTYLVSTHVYDFVRFRVEENELFIDGGSEYLRRNFSSNSLIIVGNKPFFVREFVEDYSLTSSSTIQDVLDKLLWGTFGKEGKDTLKWLPIKDLEKDHLQNILANVQNLYPLTVFTIKHWIKNHDITPV